MVKSVNNIIFDTPLFFVRMKIRYIETKKLIHYYKVYF